MGLFAQINIYDVHQNEDYDPNETTVAINPNNPAEIVAGSNINNIYHSLDSGKTWSEYSATSEHGVYGDPVFHYSAGDLFFTHLSATPGKKYMDWFDRIVVQKIEDISTWEETSYGVGHNDPKMQDKPWLSSDNVEDSKFTGNVYLTWTEFDKYESDDPEDRSRIRFSRYTPSSNEFSDAITISDHTGDCMDSDSTMEGATTAVGKYGEVFAVWSGQNKLWFDLSLDGGITWGEDKELASHVKGWNIDMKNIFRANGMPFICTDTKENIIYVCWADEFLGNADIWLIYSKDQGRTWSNRIKMNQDDTERAQYMPNITLNQSTGEVMVAYFDQRNSAEAYYYDIYMSTYKAGGVVKDYRISPTSIPLPGNLVFYGDYIDIDHQKGLTAIAYPVYKGFKSDIRVAVFQEQDLQQANSADINQISVCLNKGASQFVISAQEACEVKLKVKYTYQPITGENTKKSKEKIKIKTALKSGNEVVLWNEALSAGIYSFRFKYKIKGLSTGRVTRFKSGKKLIFSTP
ncbi:exo-alpha-sialidase [bacterium]|nr:exo-alpha-sialidase [bacterium]